MQPLPPLQHEGPSASHLAARPCCQYQPWPPRRSLARPHFRLRVLEHCSSPRGVHVDIVSDACPQASVHSYMCPCHTRVLLYVLLNIIQSMLIRKKKAEKERGKRGDQGADCQVLWLQIYNNKRKKGI